MTDYSSTIAAACCTIDDQKLAVQFREDFRNGVHKLLYEALNKGPFEGSLQSVRILDNIMAHSPEPRYECLTY